MSNRLLVAAVVLLVGLLVGLAFFWQPDLDGRSPTSSSAVAGLEGGDFTLKSADGPVSLADFRSKVVLLYFGYTYCPDVCPTSLAATAAGLNQLKPEELARVATLFVSVDPERDTPERLKEYARFFHPSIVGVTGTPAEVAAAAKRYGVFYARQKVETAGGGYVVDHTSETYVIAPDGRLAGKLPHAAPPEQVVAEIRKNLNQP